MFGAKNGCTPLDGKGRKCNLTFFKYHITFNLGGVMKHNRVLLGFLAAVAAMMFLFCGDNIVKVPAGSGGQEVDNPSTTELNRNLYIITGTSGKFSWKNPELKKSAATKPGTINEKIAEISQDASDRGTSSITVQFGEKDAVLDIGNNVARFEGNWKSVSIITLSGKIKGGTETDAPVYFRASKADGEKVFLVNGGLEIVNGYNGPAGINNWPPVVPPTVVDPDTHDPDLIQSGYAWINGSEGYILKGDGSVTVLEKTEAGFWITVDVIPDGWEAIVGENKITVAGKTYPYTLWVSLFSLKQVGVNDIDTISSTADIAIRNFGDVVRIDATTIRITFSATKDFAYKVKAQADEPPKPDVSDFEPLVTNANNAVGSIVNRTSTIDPADTYVYVLVTSETNPDDFKIEGKAIPAYDDGVVRPEFTLSSITRTSHTEATYVVKSNASGSVLYVITADDVELDAPTIASTVGVSEESVRKDVTYTLDFAVTTGIKYVHMVVLSNVDEYSVVEKKIIPAYVPSLNVATTSTSQATKLVTVTFAAAGDVGTAYYLIRVSDAGAGAPSVDDILDAANTPISVALGGNGTISIEDAMDDGGEFEVWIVLKDGQNVYSTPQKILDLDFVKPTLSPAPTFSRREGATDVFISVVADKDISEVRLVEVSDGDGAPAGTTAANLETNYNVIADAVDGDIFKFTTTTGAKYIHLVVVDESGNFSDPSTQITVPVEPMISTPSLVARYGTALAEVSATHATVTTGLYLVSASEPSIADVKADGLNATFSSTGAVNNIALESADAADVYFVLKDGNNFSDVRKVEIGAAPEFEESDYSATFTVETATGTDASLTVTVSGTSNPDEIYAVLDVAVPGSVKALVTHADVVNAPFSAPTATLFDDKNDDDKPTVIHFVVKQGSLYSNIYTISGDDIQ